MAITEWEICRKAIGPQGIQILLCDDDPAFLVALQEEIRHIFTKLNRNAALSAFSSPGDIPPELLRDCDMAFLDIDFDREDCNGIGIARKLRQVNSRALVFFVTNYIDYAPEGFEVQAFRYILKRDRDQVLERYILQAMETMAQGLEYLRLRDKDQIFDIPLQDISYLEVMDHYVSIHAGDRDYTLGATLSGMEFNLERHGYLRIHKSYLVNMRHIRKFRSRECLLHDGTSLAVSEKNYSKQKQKYLLWKGLV